LDKADKEYQAAMDAQDKVWIEYQIAYTLAGQNDVDELVEQCKYNIAQYEQQQLEYQNQVTNKEILIQKYEDELNIINTQIEAQNAIIANWKAQIEAAIEAQK
jgi:chromosome segregation ATPase